MPTLGFIGVEYISMMRSLLFFTQAQESYKLNRDPSLFASVKDYLAIEKGYVIKCNRETGLTDCLDGSHPTSLRALVVQSSLEQ
jgi:hypothetical protein